MMDNNTFGWHSSPALRDATECEDTLVPASTTAWNASQEAGGSCHKNDDAWDRKKREEREARPDWYESLSLTQDQSRLAQFGIEEVETRLRYRIAQEPSFAEEHYGWWTKDPHDWLEWPFFTSNEGVGAAFENSVFSIHAYDWGEDEDGYGTNNRNFVFKPLGIIFDWYKYVGRGITANEAGKKALEGGEFWDTVIAPCLESISDGDGIEHDVLVPKWVPEGGGKE